MLSVAVMAHRSRERFIPELLDRLDRPAEVVWDRHGDRWDTGRRAWLAVDTSASHGLVLQDDVIPCRDLVAGVELALSRIPDPETSTLCLYLGRVRPYRERITQLVANAHGDTSWITMPQIHWGPGIVLPTHLIPDMVAWCDQRGEVPNYDKRISRWCQSRGITVWYPWPSLVEHRSVRENPSLIRGRTGDRRAYRFLGEEVSALGLRWDGAVLRMAEVSSKHPRGGVPTPVRTPRSQRLGVKVQFVSPKYPQLQVAPARVRFKDGKASTDDPAAIALLLNPRVAALGVRPVGELPTAVAVVDNHAPVATTTEPTRASEGGPEDGGEDGEQAPTTVADDESDQRPPADETEVPTSGAKEVLTWVGDSPDRARQALEVERAREKPRSTLVAALTKLAG